MDEFSFRDELKQKPVNLPRAALRFAREVAYPQMDLYNYLRRLDHLIHSVRGILDPDAPYETQADVVADFLFHQLDFSGNTTDYGDPRNSYLNEVLDRRLGIPISLSVIFISVARRLGIPASGVGLPGHFVVSVQGARKQYLYDPYHGGVRISEEDCLELVQSTAGYQGPLRAEWLLPVSEDLILLRMLNNLRLIYIQREDWEHALAVIERMRLMQPKKLELLRDLGFIHQQRGSLSKAVHYYEQYLLRHPPENDEQAITKALRSAARQLARLN